MQTTRARTIGHVGIRWVSDGWEPDIEVIQETDWDRVPMASPKWVLLVPAAGVGLTQAVKHRQGRRLVRVDVRNPLGKAVVQPYTVHVERLNGVLRDRLACLTRKTHAFAKDATTWDAALSLLIFEHNWIRPHVALRERLTLPDVMSRRYARRTPAMVLELADHPWSLIEFLSRPVYHGT